MNSKRIIAFCFFAAVLVFSFAAVIPANSADSFRLNVYDPSVIYSGSYTPDLMYYKPRPRSEWRMGLKGAFPGVVKCPEARQSLENSGLWKGTILVNGTCVSTDEPAYWATGNRLNFDESNSSR